MAAHRSNSSTLYDEKYKDDYELVRKLEVQGGLVISNPKSDIKIAEFSNVEVPAFVAPFIGNTGLKKMQNMLANSTVTYIDNIPELTALEKSEEYVSRYNPDDKMKREAVLRMREFERESYTGGTPLEELNKADEEVKLLHHEQQEYGNKQKVIRI